MISLKDMQNDILNGQIHEDLERILKSVNRERILKHLEGSLYYTGPDNHYILHMSNGIDIDLNRNTFSLSLNWNKELMNQEQAINVTCQEWEDRKITLHSEIVSMIALSSMEAEYENDEMERERELEEPVNEETEDEIEDENTEIEEEIFDDELVEEEPKKKTVSKQDCSAPGYTESIYQEPIQQQYIEQPYGYSDYNPDISFAQSIYEEQLKGYVTVDTPISPLFDNLTGEILNGQIVDSVDADGNHYANTSFVPSETENYNTYYDGNILQPDMITYESANIAYGDSMVNQTCKMVIQTESDVVNTSTKQNTNNNPPFVNANSDIASGSTIINNTYKEGNIKEEQTNVTDAEQSKTVTGEAVTEHFTRPDTISEQHDFKLRQSYKTVIEIGQDGVNNMVVNSVMNSDTRAENNYAATGAREVIDYNTIMDTFTEKSVAKDKLHAVEKQIESINHGIDQINVAIKTGNFSSDDLLLPREELRVKLKEANISNNEIKNILNNKTELFQTTVLSGEISTAISRDKLKLSDEEMQYLASGKFLSDSHPKYNLEQSILTKYLRTNGSDFFKTYDFRKMSDTNIDSILENIKYNQSIFDKDEKKLLAEYKDLKQKHGDNMKDSFAEFKHKRELRTEKKIKSAWLKNNKKNSKGNPISFEDFKRQKLGLRDTKGLGTAEAVALERIKRNNARQKYAIASKKSGLGLFRKLKKELLKNDDSDTYRGFQKSKDLYRKSKMTATSIKYFGKFTNTTVIKPIAFVTTIPGRIIAYKKGQAYGFKIVKDQNKKIFQTRIVRDPYNSIYRKAGVKAKQIKQKAKDGVKSTVHKISSKVTAKPKHISKKIQTKKRVVKKKIMNSKIGKKVIKPTGKAAGFVGRIISSPFKLLTKIISKINSFKMAVIGAVASVILHVIFTYLLILVIYSILYWFADMMVESETNVVSLEQSNIDDLSEDIVDLNSDRFIDALDTALKKAKSPYNQVLMGKTIDYYGIHTKNDITTVDTGSIFADKIYNQNESQYDYTGTNVSAGYHIYYIDSNGKPVGNHTSNAKDIICMATVMLNNSVFDDEEKLDTLLNITDTLYPLMNPDFTLITSPIFHCDVGCNDFETTTYYCNEDDAYTEYRNYQDNNVRLYSSLHDKTSEGCRWKSTCNGCMEDDDNDPDTPDVEVDHGSITGTGGHSAICDNATESHYCPGHTTPKLCYGHKNINIYVTVLNKDDLRSSGDGVITYKVPAEYNENSIVSSYKERTVDIKNLDGSSWGTEYQEFLKYGGWNEASFDWIDNLYNQDWYELYGIDFNGGVGL